MLTDGLISEAALQRVLVEADSLEVRSWVLAVLSEIRERFPRCDFYVLNRSGQSEDEPRIYIGIGVRRLDTASGKNALILVSKNNTAYLGFQRKGQFYEKYRARVFTERLSAEQNTDLADVRRWLEQLDLALDAEDRGALQGEARTVDNYLHSDTPAQAVIAGVNAPSDITAQPSLNQILYGPPGTGKTYATIEAALEVLDSRFLHDHSHDRVALKQRFDQLADEGRIRFVTFHQSFSYEDFVEGLRAEPAPADAEGTSSGIQYLVEPGVFLHLCREAVRNRAFEQRVGVRDDAKVWKISIEEASSTGLTRKYCFEHGEARIGWSGVGDIRKANLSDPSFKLGTNDQSSLAIFGLTVEPGDVVVCLSTTRQISAVGVVTGEYEYSPTVPVGVRNDYVHRLPVHWLATGLSFDITGLNQGVKLTLKTMYELWRISWPALQSALLREGIALAGESVQPEEAVSQPYVLIIDEINRGNVSRILGELITLIEPSKRAGAEEALSVVLPYSKQRFSVPSNVYLIGTMNTADRSLAGLDIALRRRFTFKEMPPRPDLLKDVEVDGVNIGQLLQVINQRIEVLLDRDHCLGHAYFMSLKSGDPLERVESIFRNQILPLLQEYFFEDWERISWVLNDQQASANDTEPFIKRPQSEQSLNSLFGSAVAKKLNDQRWELNDAAFGSLDSYLNILG